MPGQHIQPCTHELQPAELVAVVLGHVASRRPVPGRQRRAEGPLVAPPSGRLPAPAGPRRSLVSGTRIRVRTSTIRTGGRCTRECSAATLVMAEANTTSVVSPASAPDGAKMPSKPAARASAASCWQAAGDVVAGQVVVRDVEDVAHVRVGEVQHRETLDPGATTRRRTSNGETSLAPQCRNSSAHAPRSVNDAYQTPGPPSRLYRFAGDAQT